MPPADKIAACFAIKSLSLFQNKRELNLGLGDEKEEGGRREEEEERREMDAEGRLKLWVIGGGERRPVIFALLALGCLGLPSILIG